MPTLESLPSEVAQLKALVPSNSHHHDGRPVPLDEPVFAGQRKRRSRAGSTRRAPHPNGSRASRPLVRTRRRDVDIQGIFDGVDTSSLAAVKAAIEKKDSAQFASA